MLPTLISIEYHKLYMLWFDIEFLIRKTYNFYVFQYFNSICFRRGKRNEYVNLPIFRNIEYAKINIL